MNTYLIIAFVIFCIYIIYDSKKQNDKLPAEYDQMIESTKERISYIESILKQHPDTKVYLNNLKENKKFLKQLEKEKFNLTTNQN